MSEIRIAKTKDDKVSPFLKWPGGKRWLAKIGVPTPKVYSRLVEPFLGSAAVFFALRPDRALLADVNDELINLFKIVRDRPDELEDALKYHHKLHSEKHYYHTRESQDLDDLDRAARTLYLNRTCWNGLYRVNTRGKFNVPKGTKDIVLWEGERFGQYASVLASAQIECQDFEATIDACGEGDFIFVDPPYTVKHNLNGFVKYNEKIFSWEDQLRLVSSLRRAGSRGASVLITNADHESVIELYAAGFEYRSVERHSVLAASAKHRGRTTEALFGLNLSLR